MSLYIIGQLWKKTAYSKYGGVDMTENENQGSDTVEKTANTLKEGAQTTGKKRVGLHQVIPCSTVRM